MRIETEEVRAIVQELEKIIEVYKYKHPKKKRDWKTYEEQVHHRVRYAIKALNPLIEEAISSITIQKSDNRGAPDKLSLKQKMMLLLIKELIGKSNREMACMLSLFSLLSDIDVSYKTVERLYSDEEVILALHNLQILLLKKKNVDNVDSCGDGTGISVTIKEHYATEAQKLKDSIKEEKGLKVRSHKKMKFVYSFRLMDIKTRMYISYGTSFKSEQEAFLQAKVMAEKIGINIKSIRLDRYYSAQYYVELLLQSFKELTFYLIPKKNATVKGPWPWKRMLYNFVNNTDEYLSEYFKRNNSENGISEDKRRFGWKTRLKKEDRIDTSNLCTLLWHNLIWMHSS